MPNNPLQGSNTIFLDTAPVIYFVEKHPDYFHYLSPVFERVDNGEWKAVVSPITISECLVFPIRMKNSGILTAFTDFFTSNESVSCVSISSSSSKLAAELRSRYNLNLLDAFQIAMAIDTQCDAFLTNDKDLCRVSELSVVTLDKLIQINLT